MKYIKISIVIILLLFIYPWVSYAQSDIINASEIMEKIAQKENIISYANVTIEDNINLSELKLSEERRKDDFGKTYYRAVIDSELYFENCIFTGEFIAYEESEAKFFDTVFQKKVTFVNCEFNNNIDFTQNVFNDEVNFTQSIFKQSTFYRANFKKNGNFTETNMENTSFERTTFTENVSFKDSIFFNVKFWLAKFLKDVDFSNVKFKDKFWLSYYVYLKDFSKIEFKGNKDFTNVTLNEKEFDPSKEIAFFEYMIIILPELGDGLINTLIFTFFAMLIGFFLAVPFCTISLYGKKSSKTDKFIITVTIIVLITLSVIVFAFIDSLIIELGIIFVLLILSYFLLRGRGTARTIIGAFVEFLRGTPLLIQLYVIYYGLPKFGIQLTPFTAALIGFTINSAAYQIEYMKGGFKAISYDQIEASHSLGMKKWQTVYRILVPQGLRFSIPALSNELIYLLKYTSLGFIIQAPELMARAKLLTSDYARYMETYIIAAFIYIILTFILSKITDIIDNKMRIPGFEPVKIR